MAYFDKSGGKLDETILKVLGTLQVVLKRTIDYAKSATKEGDKFGAKNKELRLLQSKDVIEHPPKFDAECYKL
ncbi:hypothetical protein SARC_04807 [Sphaeroforma arctica JP610]|uniref:Uncharacterized protein n=1 Tax=Sphaeroforma arctica JP610 TaxID=667725 RepID=A0A0L0G3W7_9EUKA|nr:hypothetical protein SARC_04807 [Sphaeroforma arctica JP610]KNC82913.1 hypothetical protein SARC_04807 [Sphaeroforma arctica JP610]|eukprot:XP_014156815.1 hypothetical protein SARC_04807 [Sphaeroforma arctica JP610]